MIRFAAALLLPVLALFFAGTEPPSPAAAFSTPAAQQQASPANESGETRGGWRSAVMHPLTQAFLSAALLAALYAAAGFLRGRFRRRRRE